MRAKRERAAISNTGSTAATGLFRWARLGACALLALAGTTCVQDFVSSPNPGNTQFTVNPESVHLDIGELHAPFTASLTMEGRPIGFRLGISVVSANGVVTVDSLGRLRVLARGVDTLRVRAFGPQLVEAPPETTVVVRGVVPRIGLVTQRTVDTLSSIGEQFMLFAVGLTNAGDTIPGAPIRWRLTAPGGALALDTTTGRVTALGNGVALLEAHVDAATASRSVVVRQRPVRVRAAPDTVTMIALGQTRSAVGTPYDANDNVVVGAPVLWRSLDPAVVDVGAIGIVMAVAPGVAGVVALTPRAPGDTLRDTLLARVAPARLAAAAGDSQVGTVGTDLAGALAVQLVDSAGADVRDSLIAVTFRVTGGGARFGTADTARVLTNGPGRGTAPTLTLSQMAGPVTVTATGVGLAGAAVTFNASGSPAAPQALVADSGAGQVAAVAAVIAPFVVRLRDQFNNGVPGQAITFRVTAGNGRLAAGGSPDSVVIVQTDAQGRARAVLTLDTVAGVNTVQVSGPVGGPLSFNATGAPGAPVALQYVVEPAGTTSGSLVTPAIQVAVLDQYGNRVTASAANVVLMIAPGGPAGATLRGTPNVAATAGLATFGNVTLDKAGSYRLVATATGLVAATSAAFPVAAGTPDHLVFTTQPSLAEAGRPIGLGGPIELTIVDAFGNRVMGATDPVTLTLATHPNGASLFGTVAMQATNGVATFTSTRIAKAGIGYRIIASSISLPNGGAATSALFDVAADGPASVIEISGNGQNGLTGSQLAQPFVVAVRDTFDNLVPGDTVRFRVVSGDGRFAGADTVRAITDPQGRASALLTLGATSGTSTIEAKSLRASAVVIFTASATPPGLQLAFVTPPSNTTGGSPFAPAVQVAIQDGGGVTQTGLSTNITLAITGGTGTPGATLGGTVQVAAQNGVATFNGIAVDRIGSGYTLTATASGVTSATSTAFNVTTGAASKLGFAVQPASAAAGASLGSVEVRVQDAGGNTVSASDAITLTLSGGNPGATLGGTTMQSASGGVATFSTLGVNLVGTGYQLNATATGLTGAASATFTITAGPASQLVFLDQPGDEAAGAFISPTIRVGMRDGFGNPVTTTPPAVTLAITPGTGTPGASLAGGTNPAVSGGVASFAAASIQRAGTGYTLTATAAGLSSAVSTGFNITAGTAARLGFVVEPTSAQAGQAISPTVQVGVQDQFGNPTTTSASVTLQILPGSGTTGANLLGGSASTSGGVASFGALNIDKAGAGYQLRATASGLNPDTSAAFAIAAAAAESLVVVSGDQQNGQTSQPLAQPFVVAVRDAFGNPVAGHAVTFEVTAGGGSFGGSASISVGTNASGLASATLTLGPMDNVVNTAEARAPGLVGTPRVFTATPVPVGAQLGFVLQPPGSSTAGALMAIQVAVQSSSGTTITSATSAITLFITGGTANAHLIGTQTVSASGGVATFNIGVDSVGAGYALSATASGLTGGTSTTFNITPGPATKLGFVIQPSNTSFGSTITPAPAVAVQDAQGNTVPSSSASILLEITSGSGTAGATLSGTTTQGASSGVATFPGLGIDLDGSGYSLTATSAGLTGTVSAPFNRSGGPARLVFGADPANVTAGATIAPVQVTIVDAQGITVTGTANQVTVALRSGSLGGALSAAPVNGVATFSDLSINAAGAGYALIATAGTLVADTTGDFTVVHAAPARLEFSVEPTSRTAGSPITPAVQVAVRDALGNLAASSPVDVAMAILPGSGEPGATLSGTTTITAVGGVATFPDLSIDKDTTGYRLQASSGSLTPDTSASFSIVTGPLASVVFTATTSNLASLGAQFQFVAEGRDASGNPVVGQPISWTSTDPAVATVSGTGLVTAVTNGPTTITATANGFQTSILVTVQQVTASVVVTPAGASLGALGDTQLYSAQARDSNNNPIAGKTFSWQSDATGVVSVSPANGTSTTATAVSNGTANIIATVDGVSGSVQLTVAQVVQTVTVTPAGPLTFTAFGQTQAFTAVARDANNNVIAGKTFTWNSSDPAVSVDAAGVATAAANGTASVTATTTGGPGGANVTSTAVAVTVGQVTASVVVTPGTAQIGAIGSQRTFTAEARDANNNPIAGKTFTWVSTATGVATVPPGSATSKAATAVANGSTSIEAAVDGVTGSATLTVLQVTASVVLTPASPPSLAAFNATQQFTAVARDSNANFIAGKTFTWTSTSTGVATVSPLTSTSTTTATAVGNGTTSIIATVDGRADTSALTVQQIVTTVVVTPNPQTIPVLSSRTFTAEARDVNGFAVAGIGFTWSSSNSLAVSVSANNPSNTATASRGLVVGSSTITATTTGNPGPGGTNVSGTATAN